MHRIFITGFREEKSFDIRLYFKDNTEYLLELIEKIAKNGAAALFIKLGRFIDDMPDEVRIKADELSFPIVYMPFSFLRILQLGRKE